jgi:predicted Kef-type K+ transport protein
LESLPLLLGLMLLLIVLGKFLLWTGVVWLFRHPLWTAVAVASGLTQIGELSFVVAQVARSSGVVAENVFSTVIAASLISIFLNGPCVAVDGGPGARRPDGIADRSPHLPPHTQFGICRTQAAERLH